MITHCVDSEGRARMDVGNVADDVDSLGAKLVGPGLGKGGGNGGQPGNKGGNKGSKGQGKGGKNGKDGKHDLPPGSHLQTRAGDNICINWTKGRDCSRPDCSYKHVCWFCFKDNHRGCEHRSNQS